MHAECEPLCTCDCVDWCGCACCIRCDYPGCSGPADGSECRHPEPDQKEVQLTLCL